MQNTQRQNKEFCTLSPGALLHELVVEMKKISSINDLLNGSGNRLGALKAAQQLRSVVLDHVIAALPPELAAVVVSAGLEKAKLTIAVNGGNWATRLRYVTETLRLRVGASLGVDIHSIRIKVVPPRG